MKRVAFRWLLVLILCLTLLPTVVLAETDDITPIEPDKDENGVYQISNANELYGFAEIVNDLQNEDSWNPHANAVLTADITVNEGVLKPDGTLNTEKKDTFKQWTPIGYNASSKGVWYGGTFDGQNHTISGLYCDTDQLCAGLFGHAKSNSFIKNVTVADSYFSARNYVGGVCGWNEYCTVAGCINESTVVGTSNYSPVGGVCGYSDYGYIEKCSNFGTVIGIGAHSDVGGVCGRNGHRSIVGCYNAGTVTGNGWSVGGVCGSFSQGAIIGCHNVGVVTGSGKYVGGVYGYKERNIGKGCYYLVSDAVEGDEQAKTAADFKNGTVCDLLNETLKEHNLEFMFYQGNDYPVLTPQIIFIGIEDGKTYCGKVNFTVRCAVSVTEDGKELVPDEYNQYILLPSKHTITATDAEGKSKTVAVTVNAEHTGGTATCTAKARCEVCGAEYGELIDHNYEAKYDESTHWSECSCCKDIKDRAAHSFAAHNCETSAPCTECNYVKPAGQHNYGEYKQTKAPTCTEAGEETRTCGICNYEDTRTIDALGHDFGDWTVTTEATCTQNGKKSRTCKRDGCDATDTVDIPANGHTEVTDAAVEPTCTVPGKTEGKHCSVCNEILVAQTEIPAKGHTWTAASCTAPRTCSVCSATDGNPLGHDWSDWTVTTEATCTAKGEKTRSCKRDGCDATETVDIPANGHTEVTDAAVEPTCTMAGKTEGKHCSVCNEILVAQTEIPAKGHTWTAASCTKPRTCSVCSATDGDPLGHDWSDWTVTTEATCTAKGEKTRSCKRDGCDASETVDIPANGHTEGKAVRENVVSATKDHKGSYDEVVYCTVCKTELSRVTRIIPKLVDDIDAILPILPIIGKPGTASKFPFRDVPASAWYYDAVKSAWEVQLIDGVTSTEFRPDANMTVAQAIKLASALHQMTHYGKVTLRNGAPNWYSTYVSYAIDSGLIESTYGNYTAAQMNSPVTRAEFVHIFHAAVDDLRGMNTVTDNVIPDVKTGDAFAAEIYDFYRAGILTGSDANGTFHPASSIKRSEVAAILIRMYDTSVRKTIKLG